MTFTDLTDKELCELMCGKPEEDIFSKEAIDIIINTDTANLERSIEWLG